jgi:hypothetical protein
MNREEVIKKVEDHEVMIHGDRTYPGLRTLVNDLVEERKTRKKLLWFCVLGIMSLVGQQIIWPIVLGAIKAIK